MPSERTIKKNLLRAKNASLNSDFCRQSIGAVLMQGNKVIAVGWNTSKTNPLQKEFNRYRNFKFDSKNNGTIHAEMMILLKTRYMNLDWNKCSLYIYREYKENGKPALAHPCPACLHALWGRGITQIYYSASNKKGWDKVEVDD